jgi:hypothetical protein
MRGVRRGGGRRHDQAPPNGLLQGDILIAGDPG